MKGKLKNSNFEHGYMIGKSNIKYISHTIFKDVEKALEAAEKQLKVEGMSETQLEYERGKIKAYNEYLKNKEK